ncbi:hypothetical protein [Streptomyces natalensis]|uniref:Uncharacterized protein n=1 Tax=Streptomyces natalensis ATCC 27448 TaxID=1240678 RepID=A0A0D7CKY8_9ACTN|nr:hypothetical protein [Streptomyces natalensis]KIZ16879.1 hypothetical protein SNA_18015 [Streptomyces natalensis ATCC 27448]
MTARDDLYNYAASAHLDDGPLDELLDAVEAEARADERKRVADEIHRADRPTFPDGERPDLVVSTLRNVHARIAAHGPDAPYWTPEKEK